MKTLFKKKSLENNKVETKPNNEISAEPDIEVPDIPNEYTQIESGIKISLKPEPEVQSNTNSEIQKESNSKGQSKFNEEIMNIALGLFLDFGESNKELIYNRMKVMSPNMDNEDIDKYNKFNIQVKENVFKIMENLYTKDISEENARRQILNSYPFINSSNYKRLYSLGLVSAWKRHNSGLQDNNPQVHSADY